MNLPSLTDRPRMACPKGVSRLQDTKAEKKLALVDDKTFKKDVRTRDQMKCRKCGRSVEIVVARVPKRAEVHHVYGRRGDFRFDSRFAILGCCECHEQLTGRVSEKWIVVPVPQTKFIELKGRELIDCRGPIGFERVA